MIAKLPDRNALLPDLLPFSKIDVIVTDLDGTLISGSEDISDRIKENISTLRRKKYIPQLLQEEHLRERGR